MEYYTCPYCGKKSENSDFYLDFTDFFVSEILRISEITTANNFSTIKDKLTNLRETHTIHYTVNDIKNLDTEESFNITYSKLEYNKEESKIINFLNGIFGIESKKPDQDKGFNSGLDQEFAQQVDDKENVNHEDICEKVSKNLKDKVYYLKLHKAGDEGNRSVFDTIQIYDHLDSLDSIGSITVKRCPTCHKELSYYAGMYPQIVLSVLGGPRISKTSTITACYHYFQNRRSTDGFNVNWEVYKDDVGVDVFEKNCHDLYSKGYKVVETDPNKDEEIPKITFHVKVSRSNNQTTHLCLTFVDLPGEFCRQRANADLLSKYRFLYQNVDYLLYCIDPTELGYNIPEDQCGLKESERITSQEHENLIYNIMSLFDKKTIVPTLFILGKADLLETAVSDSAVVEERQLYFDSDNLPDNMINFYDQIRSNSFDCNSYRLISGYVYDFISDHYSAFIRTVNSSRFFQKTFISVSAYGFAPVKAPSEDADDGRGKRDPKPYNIALPFYWILAHSGYLRVSCIKSDENCFDRLYSWLRRKIHTSSNTIEGYLCKSQINNENEILQQKNISIVLDNLTQS